MAIPGPAGAAFSSLTNVDAFTNKRVDFRFRGTDLTFRLSHALFSSFDVDDGTRLLLKSIAQHVDLSRITSLLDIGCGIGVIGASIRASAPHVSAVLQDRDALAAAFAEENCRTNGASDVTVACGLAFWDLGDRSFDLVTSNLPAKAGGPVLESIFRGCAAYSAPNGMAAVVIVAPLAESARENVRACGCEIVYSESTKAHTVLHFRRMAGAAEIARPREDLAPYVRTRHAFSCAGVGYDLDTAWSLPDFDTLGHPLELACDLLATMRVKGDVLAWNPGQGHLPLSVVRQGEAAVISFSLAGRDALELAITSRNLGSVGCVPSAAFALPSEAGLAQVLPAESLDFIIAVPHPVPRAPWQPDMRMAALSLLRHAGRMLVVCSSTEMYRLLTPLKGLRLIDGRKGFGFRAVLLEKP